MFYLGKQCYRYVVPTYCLGRLCHLQHRHESKFFSSIVNSLVLIILIASKLARNSEVVLLFISILPNFTRLH